MMFYKTNKTTQTVQAPDFLLSKDVVVEVVSCFVSGHRGATARVDLRRANGSLDGSQEVGGAPSGLTVIDCGGEEDIKKH